MSFNDYIYWQTLQETGKTPEEIYEYEHPEVVRCKECRYYIDNIPEDSTDDECRWRSEEQPNPDDFCSYGERKESE